MDMVFQVSLEGIAILMLASLVAGMFFGFALLRPDRQD